jgi:radical SAM superfamily enzyme
MPNIKSREKLDDDLTVKGAAGWDALIADVKNRIHELQHSLETFERCKQAGIKVKAHLLRPGAIQRLETGTE